MGLIDFLQKRKRKKYLLRNGRFMLEEMITLFNGKSNPIRFFSAPVLVRCQPYKGVKWFNEDEIKMTSTDIAVSSRMSNHKIALKLLGCCLEFPSPALVYESAEKGTLSDHVYSHNRGEILPWNIRLKIAKETAIAISYLHTALPKRIVHGNIEPANIFLDEKWTAKISNFSESISIPDGDPHVKVEVPGTMRFVDPAFLAKGCINESSDVYGFEATLLVLITGNPPSFQYGTEGNKCSLKDFLAGAREKGKFIEIIDPKLVDGAAEETLELQHGKHL